MTIKKSLLNRTVLEGLLVALLFCVLSLIAMYPTPFYWNTQMAGGSWDTGQNVWNFWWYNRSVDQGNIFPFYSDMIFFPQGVSLAYHTMQPLNGLEAVALHKIFRMSFPGAYNTILLFSAIIAGLTSYWLIKSITQNTLSGIVGGIIIVFSPTHLSRMHFGHLDLFTGLQLIPLVALCILLGMQKKQWFYAVIAGFLLGFTGWQSLHLFLGAVVFTVVVYACFGFRDLSRTLGYLFICGAITLIIMIPVIYPMLRDLSAFQDQVSWPAANSIDLLLFIKPDQSISASWRFILGKLPHQPFPGFFQMFGQKTVFVGFGVLILSIAALFFVPWKITWRWWLVAGFFMILAMGPMLVVNGRQIMPLPYALLSKLPFIGLGREPARWFVFSVICLAVVIGGLGAELTKRGRLFRAGFLLCGLLIYLEFLAIPVKLDDRLEKVPDFYQKLAGTPSTGGVLDVPYDRIGAIGPACDYMVFQIIHQKPIVSGYVSRTPRAVINPFQNDPFFMQLRARIYDDLEPLSLPESLLNSAKDDLIANQIEYVILHRAYLSEEDFTTMHAALTRVVDQPIFEDEAISAWQVAK